MPSQLLTDTQKLAEDLVTAVETHAPEVDAAAKTRLEGDLAKGERWPSLALLLTLASRRVERTLRAYADAERALEAERADDAAPRAERDARALEVSTQLRAIKKTVESLFGDAMVTKLQLPAELPRDPAKLALSAGDFLSALKTTKLPAPQDRSVAKVDASVWEANLNEPLKKLKAARAKVATEDKELTAALAARDEAAVALSEAMVEALQLARALASLAHKSALFEGLRATIEYHTAPTRQDAPVEPVKPQ